MKSLQLLAIALVATLALCVGCADEDQRASSEQNSFDNVAAVPDPFEATWQGVLFCVDCDGIDTRLELRRDGEQWTYRLIENYLLKGQAKTFESQGQWHEITTHSGQRDNARIYILGEKSNPLQSYWRRADGSLELLDTNQQPRSDGNSYRLQRL